MTYKKNIVKHSQYFKNFLGNVCLEIKFFYYVSLNDKFKISICMKVNVIESVGSQRNFVYHLFSSRSFLFNFLIWYFMREINIVQIIIYSIFLINILNNM